MSHEKVKRNKLIYTLSKKGGGNLSLRDLQTKFKFKSVKSILNIIKREHARATGEGTISTDTIGTVCR